MSYEEFLQLVNKENMELLLDEDDFSVYSFGGRYYKIDIRPDAKPQEVKLISSLRYSISDDLLVKDVSVLDTLFDCVCCGENITAEDVKYLWFKAINS